MTNGASEVLQIPLAINLVAVAAGGLDGAIRAGKDERVDVVGVFTFATVLGFGGGIVRDVLLGNLPPAVFREPAYLVTVTASALVGMLFLAYLKKLGTVVWLLDSLGIGLFACVGTNAALIAGLGTLAAVFVGTLASVGGLIIADALQGRPSSIIHVGPPNAVAGAAGAAAYSLVYGLGHEGLATFVATGVTFLVRLSGLVFDLRLPQPRTRHYEVNLHLRGRPWRRPRDRGDEPGS